MNSKNKKSIAKTLCIMFLLLFIISLTIIIYPKLISKQNYDMLEYFMLMVVSFSLLIISALYGEMWLYLSNESNKYFEN